MKAALQFEKQVCRCWIHSITNGDIIIIIVMMESSVKTATEVGVRAIQDHKVIEWNTC